MHGEPENLKAGVSLLEPLAQVVFQFRARCNIAMDVRHVVIRGTQQFQRRANAHGGAQAEPFGLQAEDTFAIDKHKGNRNARSEVATAEQPDATTEHHGFKHQAGADGPKRALAGLCVVVGGLLKLFA